MIKRESVLSDFSDSEIEEINKKLEKLQINANDANASPEVKNEEHIGSKRQAPQGLYSGRNPKRYIIPMESSREYKAYTRFTPKMSEEIPITPMGIKLNLDCILDKDAAIHRWSDALRTVFTTLLEEEDDNKMFDYVLNTLEGNIKKWWNGLNSRTRTIAKLNFEAQPTISKKIDVMTNMIWQESFGETWLDNSTHMRNKEVEDAIYKIEHLSICNMKYIREYICEFANYYYMIYEELDNDKIKSLLDKLFNKLPFRWAKYFSEKYKKIY